MPRGCFCITPTPELQACVATLRPRFGEQPAVSRNGRCRCTLHRAAQCPGLALGVLGEFHHVVQAFAAGHRNTRLATKLRIPSTSLCAKALRRTPVVGLERLSTLIAVSLSTRRRRSSHHYSWVGVSAIENPSPVMLANEFQLFAFQVDPALRLVRPERFTSLGLEPARATFVREIRPDVGVDLRSSSLQG